MEDNQSTYVFVSTVQIAPLPRNEAQRLDRLRSFGVLDTLPQKAFDDITALASAICGTPIALISLVDEDRQWFKSKLGLEASETPRDVAFCSHAIHEPDRVMVVENASHDPRFADNPLVLQDPHIRFYAGAPFVTDDGFALGTVCVIDRTARHLSDTQRQALESLANLVATLLQREMEHAELHALRSSEADHQSKLLAAITASGLDLISYIGPDCVYRYVNHRYLTYWGKNESDIVGHKVVDLTGQALFDTTIWPHLERAMAGHEVAFEAHIDFPGVGTRYVELAYIPARNEDGSTGVVVRVHDISALKRREEQLQETVNLLERKTLEQDRFIHIISHDLREPINTINNFASLLVQDDSLHWPDTAQRHLSFVAAGGQRMKALLDDLMKFLQLDRQEVERQRVDLAVVASQVRDDLAAALQRNNGRIEFGHLPMAYGDPSLLRIALQNLVANGLKFVRKGASPVVTITAYFEGDTLRIDVCDNGIGMESEQLGKIFEMFRRLHSSKTYPGSGLGLSICRRIAELHGGELSVTSKPGVGSCFTLALPILPNNFHKDDCHE
jgi:nitrogen-specific signal transduction histidine kinase